MKTKIDTETWARKSHFEFFNGFDEPFFGVVANVDCNFAYRYCKENGISFFLWYLHKALLAANQIENFRYKVEDGEVYLYDEAEATPTIGREDGTFGFSYLKFYTDFDTFSSEAEKVIEKVKKHDKLFPPEDLPVYDHALQFSSLPWIEFTSLSHARSFSYRDSSPKISFGKLTEKEGKMIMPVSVHVHHGLADGYHVGLFYEYFQEEMNG